MPVTVDLLNMCIGIAGGILAVAAWVFSKFQTKNEAKEHRDDHLRLVVEVDKMRSDLSGIRADISYIRGRLEPKGEI